MEFISLEEFYRSICNGGSSIVPEGISKELGQFNVFDTNELLAQNSGKKGKMPYNRRLYYKISLISGRSTAEYADKVIDIEKYGLLFATPKVPYNYTSEDEEHSAVFCVFSPDFITRSNTGFMLDELPIFSPGSIPVFELTEDEFQYLRTVFSKMRTEQASDYAFKYDLIRTYVMELIHQGQKLQPASVLYPKHSASERVSSLFVELLERQFPIESNQQRIGLRTAKDYADRLAVHVNHLNKVLKENTGRTTTEVIGNRITQEAKILLKQTNWTVSEIAYCLGFEEVAHFSNFFRKQTQITPNSFRN
ncbi:helix-turn-helix domain-containing protein [Fluviicola chungangensis]|uniref:Helix-turn-helix domain-containing protein n=1 Tax=Fluviicola chungangensis TaxID=2597671 RepID=A0A556N0L0_9FLAO|nr:AraC family transcriptional regulator [Fluviicola chungangensis]TSJ45731.1 helix-turn-helix domain-containing protein [Fluviicola chungangensis]